MRALESLARILEPVAQSTHRRRVGTVLAAVDALLGGARLCLTGLGRGLRSHAQPRHSIKRMDRLLGNKALHRELHLYYRTIGSAVAGTAKRPVVLVDGTRVGFEQDSLNASIAFEGRSVDLCFKCHRRSALGSRRVARAFLNQVQRAMPEDCTPIVVTDAGFRVPWMEEIRSRGWDYVARLRGTMRLRGDHEHSSWQKLSQLLSTVASEQTMDAGQWLLTRASEFKSRVVLHRGKRKVGRGAQRPRNSASNCGRYRSSTTRKKHRRSCAEGWVLATSLDALQARQVVNIYKRRMQIEESIRDTKSHRYGWALEDARSRTLKRLEVLLMLGALASLAATLTGIAAERQGWQRHYQANTLRHRRVLSVVFLGRQVLYAGRDDALMPAQLAAALEELRRTVANACWAS